MLVEMLPPDRHTCFELLLLLRCDWVMALGGRGLCFSIASSSGRPESSENGGRQCHVVMETRIQRILRVFHLHRPGNVRTLKHTQWDD